MLKNQVLIVETRLQELNDAQLIKITRAADMACFQFGKLVEKDTLYRNEDGRAAEKRDFVGEYALHIQCCFRMLCDDDVIAARNDLFQPSDAYMSSHKLSPEDALPDDFDYDIVGNNRLDEIIASTLNEPNGFIVKNVKISKFGDLIIKFKNGFILDAYVDVSGGEECWRFFKVGNESHLVITGHGLAVDDNNSD